MNDPSDTYEDIINLPHHVSRTHPHMTLEERAAQFSPFAALTGYEAAVQETARLTDTRAQLDDGQIDVINRQLVSLKARIGEQPTATITFFLPDSRKEGGAYQTVSGVVRKIDEMEQLLWMADGTKIPIPDIYEVICPDPSPEYDDIL